MIAIVGIFAIPLAYIAVLITLAVKRDPRGILVSLLLFLAALASGWWSIRQSRASTAGIGFLFLPMAAALSGFLGLGFGRWRVSAEPQLKVVAWAALTFALVIVALNLSEGARTIAKNKTRDAYQENFSAQIARDRDSIATALAANPGRARLWLDSAIRAHMNDQPFLLAALPNDSISPDLLDSLARPNDLNVTLEALRHPNTRAKTLARIYQTASYPDYFFQALAAHRNTPPEILRELYTRPRTITGLEIWFAGNPSTPKDILTDIAGKTTDPNVVNALLANPAVDCTTMTGLARNLMRRQNRSADNPSVAALTERLPTVCANAPAG